MACDVTLELFGLESNQLVTESVPEDLTLDELLVRAAKRCGISPITRNLFAFKQVNFSPLIGDVNQGTTLSFSGCYQFYTFRDIKYQSKYQISVYFIHRNGLGNNAANVVNQFVIQNQGPVSTTPH